MSPIEAYTNAQSSSRQGQSRDGEALIKAARLLHAARIRPDDSAALAEALDFNVTLWTVFQADLGGGGNPLPDAIKADILGLSLFMDKSAAKLLEGHDSETLDAMIEVNRNLASSMLSTK